MMIRHHRYLILRRLVQASVMVLLVGGHLRGWTVLVGNLSASTLLGTVPLADPFAVTQLLLAGGVLSTQVLLGAGITLVIYLLLGGRVFCAWVCPVNPLTDLANRLGRKLGTGHHYLKNDPQSGGRSIGRGTRFWLLGLSVVLSLVLGSAAFEAVSPVAMVQRGIVFGFGAGWVVLFAIFLLDLLVQRNAFCGHLCPLGAFYALVGLTSQLRVLHNHENCTDCRDCLRVCPESQILQLVGKASGSVLDGVCTNCGRCIEVCRDDALRFYPRKPALSLKSGGSL
jgi:ferredoxin-type protein NapH